MLHHHLQRFVVFGAAILFLAYAIATDKETTRKTESDEEPPDDSDSADGHTVVDVASEAGRFGTWNMAIRQAGLVPELETQGPFTLFAPTDDAFGKLKETLDELLADDQRLADVLKRHIAEGRFDASALTDGLELATLAGSTLEVTVKDGNVSVNGCTVVERDLTASNGVIHGIDHVLMPEGDAPDNG